MTDYSKREPRFLVFSVDVAEGKTVTFDSYSNKKDKDKGVVKNNEDEKSEKVTYHKELGINIDHIMASGTVPEFYDYRQINGKKFWDGGLLSNVPFRELL